MMLRSCGEGKASCVLAVCCLRVQTCLQLNCKAHNARFADDGSLTTNIIWCCCRYYARSYATIEGDMESWVMRLDESIDDTPLVR
jgi:hypothetical protein